MNLFVEYYKVAIWVIHTIINICILNTSVRLLKFSDLEKKHWENYYAYEIIRLSFFIYKNDRWTNVKKEKISLK